MKHPPRSAVRKAAEELLSTLNAALATEEQRQTLRTALGPANVDWLQGRMDALFAALYPHLSPATAGPGRAPGPA